MTDLLEAMRGCKTVQACIDLALTDAYGEGERAVAWLTCIETLFERFKHVRLLGADVTLVRFDLHNHDVVAVCQQGSRKARVTLDSLEFPDPSPVERLWLRAWKQFAATSG
jgi:predicted metal-dependent HD superfamily phosphohydrolase